MFKNQKVLVTGGGGMIGRSLVKFLLEKEAQITIADLTVPTDLPKGVEFIKVDLRYFDQCENMEWIMYLILLALKDLLKCAPNSLLTLWYLCSSLIQT